MAKKVVLAGGSGFLGGALVQQLARLGWEIVVLSRSPRDGASVREVFWNGETGGAWAAEVDGADALVNLAGRSINCVFTLENTREILASRLNTARALGKAVAKAKRPPAVWVQASAVGYYGSSGDGLADEDSPPGRDFMAEVCRQWEEACTGLDLPKTRRVVLRLGVVLGLAGGAYPPMARLARRFLGGAAGGGRQGFSWVHVDDAVGAFAHALENAGMSGAYNLCSPEPVTNGEFMRALRHSVIRPWAPPAPAWAVRLVARHLMLTEPALILEGRRVVPKRLPVAGFTFKFPGLAGALQDLAKW